MNEIIKNAEKVEALTETDTKCAAARTLADEIFQLTDTAEKAHFIAGDIYNYAFSDEEPYTEEELMRFAVKYEKLRLQLEILLDYTFRIKGELFDLDAIVCS